VAQKVSDKQFAKSRHRYTDPRTGERVIGVTSIAGAFDDGNKIGAGAGAAVKLERAGIDYRREWQNKKELGSRVHGYAQLWVEGRAADIEEGDAEHMKSFRQFINDKKPEWIEVERAVISSLGYGGRFDAVVFID
jgi:acylphosphatase